MLKTLLSQVKEYKTASLLAPLFTALEVVMELFIPFITWPEDFPPRLPPASPATCGTPSTPRCRPSRFPTLTSTAPPGWSPV